MKTGPGKGGALTTGTLVVTWNANTEPDLAGYLLSIGTLPGQYATTLDVGNQTTYLYAEPDSSVTYYFAVRAYNTSGLTSPYSTEVHSTPLTLLPSVVTGTATAVSRNGATLNGTANPNGISASGYFQYGLTPAYGMDTPLAGLGSGTQSVPILNGAIANLICGTTYNFRAVALNTGGSAFGSNATLTTSPCLPPIVVTGGAIAISETGATLTATIDTRGVPTTASFEYGATTQYGLTTASTSLYSGNGSVAIPTNPLSCGALYHYRALGTTAQFNVPGADATFSTSQCAAQAPAITVQPRDTRISAGRTAQLSVQATGTAPFAYQWYRGASGVMTDPMPGATASVFVTPPLNSDTNFWVLVSNRGGATNSNAARVDVKGRR